MEVIEIISVFSCFISDTKLSDENTEIPLEIKHKILNIKDIYDSFIDLINERKLFFARNETFDTSFIKYIYKWYQAENTNDCISILKEYISEKDSFIGQFVKKILKIVNISREVEKMCETRKNMSLLSKIKKIEQKLLKSIVTTQSLYF